MTKRRRRISQRTCVGCRQVAAKRSMVRIVRTPENGVQLDLTGKLPGRGAYLHEDPACWEAALTRNRLAQALKTELSPEEQKMLAARMVELAKAPAETSDGAK
ncbi:MAG: RNase P modulator RnpM [Anaerolineae bacterium]